jgi:lipopolysaccharide export system protein LptA
MFHQHQRNERLKMFSFINKYLFFILSFNLTLAYALDSDQYQPMHVISDTATYDRNLHTITYIGSVQAEQGSSHLDGDKVIVYQTPDNSNKIQKIEVFGNPAHYNTLPAPDKDRLFVQALKITYNPLDRTVLLEQEAKVQQGGNIFTGPHIWYDMVNGVVRSLAAPGKQRTVMIIEPEKPPVPTKQ